MNGIYVSMTVQIADAKPWLDTELLVQLELLRKIKGFEWLDMGDDDLLGGEISVKGQTTKEGALEALEDMGLELGGNERAEHTIVDGEPAIRLVSKGALERDATVGDLLVHLEAGEKEFTAVEKTKDTFVVRGFLSDYDAYREYRLPMAYAIAAAHTHGGKGRLTFLGESDGEFVATFVDADGKAIAITEEDPQDLTEEDWDDRIGDLAAIDRAFASWLKSKPASRSTP